MIKSLLLSALYKIARQYFDRDLFVRVEQLVIAMLGDDLSGDEKRQKVREAALAEFRDLASITGGVVKSEAGAVSSLLGIAVDTIIQVVLMRAKLSSSADRTQSR
jgi:hypothetical protein